MNIDEKEINKFAELASRWWDKESEFKPLHEINPLRISYIKRFFNDFKGKKVLDVGCGGGILSEAIAQLGAEVTGIDMAEAGLEVAKIHLMETNQNNNIKINYQKSTIEDFAKSSNQKFDFITCLEMLEHVPDPKSIVESCSKLVKDDGLVFFSTLNRNLKSYLFAIIGAEYVLNLLPKGTHDHDKFIKPSELSNFARNSNLKVMDITGMNYNPLTKIYSLGKDVSVNYLMTTHKQS